MRRHFFELFRIWILCVGACVMVAPMVWMLFLSFHQYPERYKNALELMTTPWTLINYTQTLEGDSYGIFFANSMIVAAIVTTSNIILCFLVAYGLARKRITGHAFVWVSVIGMLALPQQILMIPIYRMMVSFGWINTYAALTVPWLVTPFGIFFLYQYIQALPKELEDAARLDGASEIRIIAQVVMPLARPALIVLGLYTFLSNWNSFLFPFLLTNDESHRTLPVALAFSMGKQSIDWGQLMAGASIAAIPVVVLFLLFQRSIIAALTAGALKG